MAFKSSGKAVRLAKTGIDTKTGKTIIKINPAFYRPAEVDLLIGDASKAKTQLNWTANTTLEDLCQMMANADLKRVKQEFHFEKCAYHWH